MIAYCYNCEREIALDSDWFPFCNELCDEEYDDYEPGDEEDYDPLEGEADFGWDDDGLDPWGYER